MSKQIQLSQGQVATVCECCAHKIEERKWFATWNPRTKSFYAVRNATVAERLMGAPAHIFMHQTINGTPKGMETDHQNGDTLDNRCANLRPATAAQNQHNQRKHADNTSGYKGVFWRKGKRKWYAQITANGTQRHLGCFATAEEAARAYDQAARELHSEFAKTNF